MSKSTRKRIQEGITYPDLSLISSGNQPATEAVNAGERVEEPKQNSTREKKTAARRAEDQQDEEARAKLLREGELNAQHNARSVPVPAFVQAIYTRTAVIQSFQKLWENPQVPDPLALKSLDRWNDIIEEEVEVNAPQNENKTRPERWIASLWKLPVREFLTFAVGAKKVIVAKKGGSNEQAFQKAGINSATASRFVTTDLPLFHIRMCRACIPWKAYIADDLIYLFYNLSPEENQARENLITDFTQGDSKEFLQQLSQEDKQLIGISTAPVRNRQKSAIAIKHIDKESEEPYNGNKKRLIEMNKDEDTPMFAAAPDTSAVDNDSTPDITAVGTGPERAQIMNDPTGIVAAPVEKMVNTNTSLGPVKGDSTGSGTAPETTQINKAASKNPESVSQSQDGLPTPEVGLQVFSLEINDDGRTFLGQVVHVIKIGERGSRVVVNEGTERCPSFAVHPGAAFGVGVARGWIENNCFGSDLDQKSVTRTMIKSLTNFVDVARVVQAPKRDQRQIRLYRIQSIDRAIYWITKHYLVSLIGQQNFKRQFEPLEDKIQKLQDQRRAKLDRFRQGQLHPDTAARLSREDLELMPWLGDVLEGKNDGVNGNQRRSQENNDQNHQTASKQDNWKRQQGHQKGQQDHEKGQQDHEKGQQDHEKGQQDHEKGQQDHEKGQQDHEKGQQDHEKGQQGHQKGQQDRQKGGQQDGQKRRRDIEDS
ncbi:MAG: hypothetical protein L6R36_007509 [Xanthoria steineri]|nr:MAG: hypothetical protein L6R36_007509 [Xanthoria steineri]